MRDVRQTVIKAGIVLKRERPQSEVTVPPLADVSGRIIEALVPKLPFDRWDGASFSDAEVARLSRPERISVTATSR
jgi:hypothetical protein